MRRENEKRKKYNSSCIKDLLIFFKCNIINIYIREMSLWYHKGGKGVKKIFLNKTPIIKPLIKLIKFNVKLEF